MKTIVAAVLLFACSVACQQPSLPDLQGDAQEIIEGARIRADELRELSAEELEELWAIEYTSLEVPHADLAEVDELLNELGRERWE